MELLTANRYYALNDRTIHLLSQGEVDMSATSAEFGLANGAAANNASDAEVEELLGSETEVEISVVDQNTTRQGGAFSRRNMAYSKTLAETAINITVCI